jgi:hypothetical protein
MSELVPVTRPVAPAPAAEATLPADAPSLGELFAFAADAEQRFTSLRLRILERHRSARGEEPVRHEVLVRHPGMARVTRHRGDDPLGRDHDVWVSDGETVRTYAALDRRASVRRPLPPVVGAERPDLPEFARLRIPLTALPPDSLADAFVHPHGLFRNVLVTGPLGLLGSRVIAGREAWVVRSEHPRSTLVLTDRPDRQVEVGIDRMTGLLLLLVERVADEVTRHAEVTGLELDAPIPDEAFALHLGPDVRLVY